MRIAAHDGRDIDVRASGPEDGPVVVLHHGTPGSAHQEQFVSRAVHRRNWRLVTFSRPGYAGSSRAPGHRVADIASDFDAVLDAVGAHRSLVAGVSGGAPHALACAALRPERVRAVLAVSAIAPFEAAGLDYFADMGASNVAELEAASGGEDVLRPMLEAIAPLLAAATPELVAAALGSVLNGIDRERLSGELGTDLAASVRDALSVSVDGWIDDDLALVTPWGFDPGAIARPVTLWHGGADLMVPSAHGRWLGSQIPGATLHIVDDAGHVSLAFDALAEMLDELGALRA